MSDVTKFSPRYVNMYYIYIYIYTCLKDHTNQGVSQEDWGNTTANPAKMGAPGILLASDVLVPSVPEWLKGEVVSVSN